MNTSYEEVAAFYERLRLHPDIEHSSPQETSDTEPVRLIDVCSTIDASSKGSICFKTGAGRGWGFHVISHTWSLDVRKLSERIGKELVGLKAQATDGTDTYNEAFKQADFSREPCYKRLIEVLQLLVPEGVREIWFDALCINQVDNKEKDREIQNMGSYYGRSIGCYVISHGLGEGFDLWGKDGALPRWFTRVWTFREFMLPKRLFFIVEGLDQDFIEFVNSKINAKSKKGLCRCFVEEINTVPGQNMRLWGYTLNSTIGYFQSSSKSSGSNVDYQTLISCNIDELCVECKSAPMIRKADIQGAALYLVEREAYLGVMQFGASRKKYSNERVKPLCGLYYLFSKKRLADKDAWPLRFILNEIRTRQCSVEEDRVLGILAVLNVQLSQVRSGTGLLAQLVELVKVCDDRTLLELCIMDPKPHSIVGMSWAPDLMTMADKHLFNSWNSYNMRHRPYEDGEIDLKKLRVYDTGSIQISAKVVSGMVVPCNALPITLIKEDSEFFSYFLDCDDPPKHFFVFPILRTNCDHTIPKFQRLLTPSSLSSASMDWCSFIPLELLVTKISEDCGSISLLLKFVFHWISAESHKGELHLPIITTDISLDLNQLEVTFQAEMVVVGTERAAKQIQSATLEPLCVIKLTMVCLTNTSEDGKEEELHKIGLWSLKEEATKCALDIDIDTFMVAHRRNCLIGGFGPNLSSHVTIKHSK